MRNYNIFVYGVFAMMLTLSLSSTGNASVITLTDSADLPSSISDIKNLKPPKPELLPSGSIELLPGGGISLTAPNCPGSVSCPSTTPSNGGVELVNGNIQIVVFEPEKGVIGINNDIQVVNTPITVSEMATPIPAAIALFLPALGFLFRMASSRNAVKS